jgi:hypothetical protein
VLAVRPASGYNIPVARTISVYLESGDKRVFAAALGWPGWARSGRTEADALAALVSAGPRYAAAVRKAAPSFVAPKDPSQLEVVHRLKGGTGTDFGVPGRSPEEDREPIGPAEAKRLAGILQGAWDAFDAAAKAARGVELRKGPRGGGRDLDKIVGHVAEAEEAYVHQAGAKRSVMERGKGDPTARRRAAVLDVVATKASGKPLPEPNAVRKPWSTRYFVRRTAWHVLDHAWEIEDRARPEPEPG